MKVLPYEVILVVVILAGCDAVEAEEVPLTVAAVSMNAVTDKEANLQKFFTYMEEAAEKGAHLIASPVSFSPRLTTARSLWYSLDRDSGSNGHNRLQPYVLTTRIVLGPATRGR
jgi:hypothetical protein